MVSHTDFRSALICLSAASKRLCIFAIASCSVVAKADVAEVFGAYVDTMIPLTHDIAKKSAHAREIAVTVDQFSELQSYLSSASKSSVQLKSYLDKVPSDGPLCPRLASGLVDLKEVFRRSSGLMQAVNHSKHIHERLARFNAAKEAMSKRCQNPDMFVGYDEKQLGFVFHIPQKTEVFDGVKIIIVSGDNAGKDGEDGVVGAEAIPLIGSFIRIVNNLKQRAAIGDHANRLNNQTAHSSDFQKYAMASCGQILLDSKTLLDAYAELADELQLIAEGLPTEKLLQRAAAIQSCSENFEVELANLLREEADDLASRKFGKQESEALFFKRYPDINAVLPPLLSQLKDLRESPCDGSRLKIDHVRTIVEVAKALNAESAPIVNQAQEALKQRENLCGWGES